MKLLNFIDYQVKVSPEAFLVKPIRKLYNQDRTKTKEQFMQLMSYLYFMVDPRSTYNYVLDEDERAALIIAQEGLPKDFKPSPLLKEAMEIYKQHTVTSTQVLLQKSINAGHKLANFLEQVDLTEEDDKGRPKYQPSMIASSLKSMKSIIDDLSEMQKKVEQEIEEQGRAKGAQKTMFEDGFDFESR